MSKSRKLISIISLAIFIAILGITKTYYFDRYLPATFNVFSTLKWNLIYNFTFDENLFYMFLLIFIQNVFLILYINFSDKIANKKLCYVFAGLHLLVYFLLLYVIPFILSVVISKSAMNLALYGESFYHVDIKYFYFEITYLYVLNSFILEFILFVVLILCSNIKKRFKIISIGVILLPVILFNHISFMIPFYNFFIVIPRTTPFYEIIVFFLNSDFVYISLLVLKEIFLFLTLFGTIIYGIVYTIVNFKKYYKLLSITFLIILIPLIFMKLLFNVCQIGTYIYEYMIYQIN